MNVNRQRAAAVTSAAPDSANAPHAHPLPDLDSDAQLTLPPLPVARTLVTAPQVSDMSRSARSESGSTMQLLVQQGQRVQHYCNRNQLLMVPIIAGSASSTAAGAYCLGAAVPVALKSSANLITAIGYGTMTVSCGSIALIATGELVAASLRHRRAPSAPPTPAPLTLPPEHVVVVQQPDGAVLLGTEQIDRA